MTPQTDEKDLRESPTIETISRIPQNFHLKNIVTMIAANFHRLTSTATASVEVRVGWGEWRLPSARGDVDIGIHSPPQLETSLQLTQRRLHVVEQTHRWRQHVLPALQLDVVERLLAADDVTPLVVWLHRVSATRSARHTRGEVREWEGRASYRGKSGEDLERAFTTASSSDQSL